ncbi:hypothetical protein MYX07_00515 [Patescibacteria group bacterium AH-259-L07]|nr:hypothetical protein [Patescibacteria group bacterium AH-259-L07]
MQFVVPQFIDVESKIIGPVTPKQFVILIITALFLFVSYKLADFTLFIIEAVIIFGLGVTLAFLKVNGQPFYFFLLNIGHSLKKPSLRIWKKEMIPIVEEKGKKLKEEEKVVTARKPLATSKLSQLALQVDTGGRYEEE